jgi:hypothetical protein
VQEEERRDVDGKRVVPVHTMKKYWRSRGNFGTRWRSLVNITPGHFTPGKEPRYPLNRRLGGNHCQSRRCGGGKNLLPPLGFELKIFHPVA